VTQKCKDVAPGTLCVSAADMERSENPGSSVTEQLRELKKLRDQQLIADEEHETRGRLLLTPVSASVTGTIALAEGRQERARRWPTSENSGGQGRD
jgi:hypothetical protein